MYLDGMLIVFSNNSANFPTTDMGASPNRILSLAHVWSYDFVFVRDAYGGKIRMLTMIDEYTRRCLTIHCARRIGAIQVIEQLADVMLSDGIPEYIRSDNGPEFLAKELRKWLGGIGVKTAYIEPGSPWENGYCERFNGTFRDNLLDGEVFYSLKEERVIVGE